MALVGWLFTELIGWLPSGPELWILALSGFTAFAMTLTGLTERILELLSSRLM